MKNFHIIFLLLGLLFISVVGCEHATVTFNGPLTIRTKTISIEADSYRVNIKYPFTNSPAINASIKKLINEQVRIFKRDSKAARVNPDWVYELWIDHKSWKYSDTTASFEFEIYEFTGGAHGTTKVVTKVIDAASGKEYGLADIFRKRSGYADVLSGLCEQQLREKLGGYADDRWIARGAGPRPENFRHFVLTPCCLKIYFEQYQVGPYAVGIQEVTVAIDKLKDILEPKFGGM